MSRLKQLGEDNRYHFIYITTNLINGKKYLGKHTTTNLNDGYLGCGICRSAKGIVKDRVGFGGAVSKYHFDNCKFKKENNE